MINVKFIQPTTVTRYAIYEGKRQKHLVDYFPNEKIEAVELIKQNNPKIVKILLPDEDVMIISVQACVILSVF